MSLGFEIRQDREIVCNHTRYRWYCNDCGQESFWQDNRESAFWLAQEHMKTCGQPVENTDLPYVTACGANFERMGEQGQEAFAEMLRLTVRAVHEGRL